jgi:hypothetical protein
MVSPKSAFARSTIELEFRINILILLNYFFYLDSSPREYPGLTLAFFGLTFSIIIKKKGRIPASGETLMTAEIASFFPPPSGDR